MLEILEGSEERLSPPSTLVYLFPGQSSQKAGMGERLMQESDVARAVFQQADDYFGDIYQGQTLTEVCRLNPDNILSKTRIAQPAIFTHSVATNAALQSAGVMPSYVAGHSLGEIAAYVSAGGLSIHEGFAVVKKRGELMEAAGFKMGDGGMGVLSGLPESEIVKLINNIVIDLESDKTPIYIANKNLPDQVVVSGYRDAIRELLSRAGTRAKEIHLPFKARELDVEVAAHSPFMGQAAEQFRDFLDTIDFKMPNIPIILNRTNDLSQDPDEIKNAFSDQLTRGIDWVQMQKKFQELGVDGIIEVGPGEVLANLARKSNYSSMKDRILSSEKISGFGSILQVLRT